jgi:hypothetical protein
MHVMVIATIVGTLSHLWTCMILEINLYLKYTVPKYCNIKTKVNLPQVNQADFGYPV